jgi:hypothetical protein
MADGSAPSEITTCRSCGAVIRWEKTENGKAMPISIATGESHFIDCPQSKKWSGHSRRESKAGDRSVQP